MRKTCSLNFGQEKYKLPSMYVNAWAHNSDVVTITKTMMAATKNSDGDDDDDNNDA